MAQYKAQMGQASIGKQFDECYDLEMLQPAQEYLELYEWVKEKLSGFGLDYSLL